MPTKKTKKSIIANIKNGTSPSEICNELECTISGLKRSVNEAIGEGTLKRSDLYFSVPENVRQYVSKIRKESAKIDRIEQKMEDDGLDAVYIEIFHSLNTEDQFYGDMYEYVREIEISLHKFVKDVLIGEFGEGEMNWWREIPESVRKSCAMRREVDSNPTDFYNYTYIKDLKKIVNSHWSLFNQFLPKEWASNKNNFKRAIDKLNTIRNSVMHPVKGREWSMENLGFVRKMHNKITKLGQAN